MSDLAPMREQVYADERPKEHFDRFHERSRTREQRRTRRVAVQ